MRRYWCVPLKDERHTCEVLPWDLSSEEAKPCTGVSLTWTVSLLYIPSKESRELDNVQRLLCI